MCVCICVHALHAIHTNLLIHTHEVIVLLIPLIIEGFLASDSIFYFFIEPHAVNLQ